MTVALRKAGLNQREAHIATAVLCALMAYQSNGINTLVPMMAFCALTTALKRLQLADQQRLLLTGLMSFALQQFNQETPDEPLGIMVGGVAYMSALVIGNRVVQQFEQRKDYLKKN